LDDSVQYLPGKLEDIGLRTNEFDPLAYIENAFLDIDKSEVEKSEEQLKLLQAGLSDSSTEQTDFVSNPEVQHGVASNETVSSRVVPDSHVEGIYIAFPSIADYLSGVGPSSTAKEEPEAKRNVALEPQSSHLDVHIDVTQSDSNSSGLVVRIEVEDQVHLPTAGVQIHENQTEISSSSDLIIGGFKEELQETSIELEVSDSEAGRKAKFRKTVMSAPRPRRTQNNVVSAQPTIDPELQSVWQALPKNVAFLCGFYDDSVTSNYYRGEFKESRVDLVRRLLDPELSLEETSRLLGVCPATVRRYTNREWLTHHRTSGGQRRFRLSDVVKFVDEHGRFPEE
jgi:Helix-turn-helix domain